MRKPNRRPANRWMLGVLLLPMPALATVYDAFAQFNRGDGTNQTTSTWHYLTAADSTVANSAARLLPTYSYRDYSTAYEQDNGLVPLGLGVPRGERIVWNDPFAYVGAVIYDSWLESPDRNGNGTELVTALHISTRPIYVDPLSGYGSHADTMIAFRPTLTEQTTVRFDFGVASDYDVDGALDCGTCSSGTRGMNLGLFLNDTQLPANLFWTEDGNPDNGSQIAGTEWINLNPYFARFDAPIRLSFDLTMNPGDIFYLRVNDRGDPIYDGLVLTQATATLAASTTTTGGVTGVPEGSTLSLLLGGLLGLTAPIARRRRRKDG